MFSQNPEFSPNSPRIVRVGEYAGDQVWLLVGLRSLSKRSSQLAMVTFTVRLCYSSMSIWKLNFVSFLLLFVQLTIVINVSRRCTDERSCVRQARTNGCVDMNAISTLRHGAIFVGVTLAVAIGLYLAVLLSLFDP